MTGKTRFVAIGAALLAVAATPAVAQQLTADAARAKVTVHEDPLEVEAMLSTRGVLRSTRGVLKTPHNDTHLQAFVDRKTGATRFEVRQVLQYVGSYRDFARVNYETAAWPATASLRKLDENQAACDAIDPQSSCYEEVAFVVDEAELRRLAADADQGASWSFKFKPQQGREHRASLPKAEIAGLLGAVDAYRSGKKAGQSLAFAETLSAPGAQ